MYTGEAAVDETGRYADGSGAVAFAGRNGVVCEACESDAAMVMANIVVARSVVIVVIALDPAASG